MISGMKNFILLIKLTEGAERDFHCSIVLKKKKSHKVISLAKEQQSPNLR
jgi:hypothetical protein